MNLLLPLDILIPVALAVVVLIIILWILHRKNKKMHQEISSKKERASYYKKETKKITLKNPQKDFERLNKLSREFFKENFNLGGNLTFLELAENFKKQNKKEHANLCSLMSDASYKGEKIKTSDIKHLTRLFSKIMKEV